MKFHPPALLKATVAVIASGMAAYLQKNRFQRKRVMIEHSRINLLKLPDEIILQIFQQVHDTPTPASSREGQEEWTCYDRGTRDIQSIRLTCRKFNRIGSEFLIKFVGVDVSAESLGRLQDIMRHPTIVKGVRMVKIRLLVYDWVLHISREQYNSEMRGRLHSYGRSMDRAVSLLADRHDDRGQRVNFPTLEQLDAASESAHQQYRRRYLAQSQFSKRQFVEDVSKALEMSKRPLRIEITDRNDFEWSRLQSTCRASKENQLDLFLRPQASTWQELHVRWPYISRDLAWMIPPMLEHFGNKEIRIGELHFDITRNEPSVQQISPAVEKALEEVRKFSYRGHVIPMVGGNGPKWRRMLYDCLPPESLQEVALRRVELEPSPQWRSLTRVVLIDVKVDVKRLTLLLKPLRRHSVDIRLVDCVCTGGSWADILDLLRKEQRWARLDWPKGVVLFDDKSKEIIVDDDVSPETMNYLFVHLDDWHGGASKAEQYIQGRWDANPIRQHVRMDMFD